MGVKKYKKRYNKISLKVILLLTIVIVFAISIFIVKVSKVILESEEANYNSMTEMVSEYFNDRLNGLANQIDKFQFDFIEHINEIEKNNKIEDNNEIEKYIEESLRYHQDILDGLVFFDTKNLQIKNYELNNLDEFVIKDGYSSNGLKKAFFEYAENPNKRIYSNEENIFMISNLYDEEGKIYRVIGFKIDNSVFEFALEGNNYYSKAEVGLVNDNGIIIAHTDDSLIGENIYDITEDENLLEKISESLSKNLRFIKRTKKLQADEYLNSLEQDYLFIPIEIKNYRTSWGIMFNVPANAFKERANNIAFVILFGGLVTILILIFATRLIISRALKPIDEIVDVMSKIEDGNFQVRTNIKTRDEMSKIGNNLNSMLDSMESSRNDLIKQKNEISDLLSEVEYLMQENDSIYFETIKSLANTIDAKDSYTGGHCNRVDEYAMLIGKEYGLSLQELKSLSYSAILHDIGKIGISEKIITKVGKLSYYEFDEIKKHPRLGYEIVKDIHFLKDSKDAILHHHERIDGSGYPDGLRGNEISILARIISLADSFDAMTSDRSYRKALEKEAVINELIRNKNYQFDEELVDILLGLIEGGKIKF